MLLMRQTPSNVIRAKEASSPNPVNATRTKKRSAPLIRNPREAAPPRRSACLTERNARAEIVPHGRTGRDAAHFHM